jgi:hypothetical protein
MDICTRIFSVCVPPRPSSTSSCAWKSSPQQNASSSSSLLKPTWTPYSWTTSTPLSTRHIEPMAPEPPHLLRHAGRGPGAEADKVGGSVPFWVQLHEVPLSVGSLASACRPHQQERVPRGAEQSGRERRDAYIGGRGESRGTRGMVIEGLGGLERFERPRRALSPVFYGEVEHEGDGDRVGRGHDDRLERAVGGDGSLVDQLGPPGGRAEEWVVWSGRGSGLKGQE